MISRRNLKNIHRGKNEIQYPETLTNKQTKPKYIFSTEAQNETVKINSLCSKKEWESVVITLNKCVNINLAVTAC